MWRRCCCTAARQLLLPKPPTPQTRAPNTSNLLSISAVKTTCDAYSCCHIKMRAEKKLSTKMRTQTQTQAHPPRNILDFKMGCQLSMFSYISNAMNTPIQSETCNSCYYQPVRLEHVWGNLTAGFKAAAKQNKQIWPIAIILWVTGKYLSKNANHWEMGTAIGQTCPD